MKEISIKQIAEADSIFVQGGVIELSKELEEIQTDSKRAPILSTEEFGKWIEGKTRGSEEASVSSIRRQLHELGHIIDFSLEYDIIVLNPVWLADAFKSILSFK